MRTYEYPLGVTFRASTPEHAAARVFGGKPADYLAVKRHNHATAISGGPDFQWVEVIDANTHDFVGDIPVIN